LSVPTPRSSRPADSEGPMDLLYVIIVAGIGLWLLLVFETLLGMRVVKLKGALHHRVHRIIAYTLVFGGLLHGFAAVGHLVLGLF
jgi:hypothetical protein